MFMEFFTNRLLFLPGFKGPTCHPFLQIVLLDLMKPIDVVFKFFPWHRVVDLPQDFSERRAILEVGVWEVAFALWNIVGFCCFVKRACCNEHAVSEDKVLPAKGNVFAIAHKQVCKRLAGIRQD